MRLPLTSLLAILALLTAFLCALPAANAASAANKGVSADNGWAPPSVSADMGAGYLTITNHGAVDDLLTGAESDCCAAVEVHEDFLEGGVSHMRRIERLVIAAHKTVAFEPKGRHLMLIDLKAPLTEGGHFTVTLHFAHAPDAKVPFIVSQARLLEALKSPRAN